MMVFAAIALLSLAVAGQATTHNHHSHALVVDSCSWTPLLPHLACQVLDLNESEIGLQNNRTDGLRRAELPTWTGPYSCAGKYCVFANRGFMGGRGIAVITTQENIQRVKEAEARLSSQNETRSSSTPPPFRITQVEGKGLGTIANKTLSRGDPVMAWTPALLVHRNFIDRIPRDEQYPLLDAAVELLPAVTRRRFMKQMGHFGGHKISDILATNSFQMDLGGEEGHHYGNFPEVSRHNHDCRPNVAFFIDENLVHHTTAVRPVKPGEELTISYLDPLGVRSVRQHRARRAWGFDCSCSQCSLSSKLASKSDERLFEIEQLEKDLMDLQATVTTAKIERYIKLYMEERLESKLAGAYTSAALNYNLLGRNKQATKYARLSIEAGLLESGPVAPDMEAMRALASDPKKHFTWRGRLK